MGQRLPWRLLIAGVAVVLGILIAAGEVGNWGVLLRYVYQVPYGLSDPQYGKDIGFYLFSLPAYVALKNWLLLMLVLSFLIAGVVYWVPTTEARRSRWPKTSQSSRSITSGFECEISTARWPFTGCLGLLWCAAPRATMSRSFATSTEWSSISCSTPMPAIRPPTF
jgi:uncharacterized membrane protein (UPF0182 family)